MIPCLSTTIVVGLAHFLVHVAQQWKGYADFIRERRICRGAVNADAKNFGVRGVYLSFGDTILVCLKLLRSTAGEGQDVERQNYVFLPAIIAQLHGFPLVA